MAQEQETLKKAIEFLRIHNEVAFATVENGKPKIRVFQIMKMGENDLYFVTSPSKEVYRQLRENPSVEIMSMEGDIFVRIAGEAVFDVDDKAAREIYATTPVLQRLYKDYADLVYFRLPISSLDYYDLRPTPPLQAHFEYGQK